MPRFITLPVFAVIVIGVASVASGEPESPRMAVTGAAALMPSDVAALDDPFPIARLRVTEAQLPDALKQFDRGTLVRLPRAEFEARVRKAAVAGARAAPAIVEAKYSAVLAGSNLSGDAEWTVLNPRQSPAALPLDPLRIAIRTPKWADGKEAHIGALGPGPGLWVPATGRHAVKAKWSAAGKGVAGQRQFDVRVPSCPSAVLELDLPLDRVPTTSSADVLLTGPFPIPGDDEQRRWRFRFGERGRLEFGIRGPTDSASGGAVAALGGRKPTYEIAADGVACTFEYDLRAPRGTVSAWAFALSPGLQVLDAEANDRVSWRVDPKTRELHLALGQPATSGKVVVSAIAPLPPRGRMAPLPMVRPLGAAVLEERLDLRVHPDLELERLEPGDYRLVDSSRGPDGFHAASLIGSLLEAGADASFRRPPSIRLAAADPDFTVDEGIEWRLDGGREHLAARFGIRVRRGPLFRVAIRVPAGFALDRATSNPEDAIATIEPVAAAVPTVEVEFARPQATGQRVDLRLELRGPLLPADTARLPFPPCTVLGAAQRDGWISFTAGPARSLTAQPHRGATGPEGVPADADRVYAYRGNAPDGERILTPERSAEGAFARAARIEREHPRKGTPTEASPSPRAWAFDGLHLITLCGESHALVVFGGAATARNGSSLPIGLPEGAEVRAASVGGHWLDPGRCETSAGSTGPVLRLPIPAGSGSIRFEVRYRLPTRGTPLHHVSSPEPILPGDGNAIARWWAFPRGVAAAWPLASRDRTGPADLPILLGEALDRQGELTLSRYPGETITVASSRVATATGFALAALLTAVGLLGMRAANRALGLLLLVAAIAAGVANLLGPPAWELAARAPLVASLLGVAAIAVARGIRVPRAAIAVAVLLCAVPLVAVRAQTATPRDVVFILTGPDDDPKRETVLAPLSTLDRLDALQKQPVPGTVITSASYAGRAAEDGLARFTARFTVQAFGDGESSVGLPLAEARLERVTVDGKAAHPVAVRPDLYTVAVVGRGRREVEVLFAAPIAATGPEREVRFGMPEVPDSRMTFQTPLSARQFQAIGRYGAQKTATEKDAIRLDADLGGIRTAHIRWRQGAGGAAAITVREGCVWDVSESGHALTACYQVRIDSGSVAALRFDLPAGLEPVRVAVRSLDATAGPSALRDWSIGKEAAGMRPLTLDLTGPTDGRLLVTLACPLRGAPSRVPVLRFPRPVGMTRLDAVYGLRAAGVAIESVGRTGVIDFAADVLAREFGAIPDLRLSPAVPVVAFSPRSGEAAELRPVLRVGAELPSATQEIAWRVGPHRADGDGTIKWTAKEAVPMLEFATPGVRVVEVRGAEVAGWAQTDERVQVWFRKPAREGSVEWIGTFVPSPTGKPIAEPLAFDAPVPTLPRSRITSQVVRIHPADGWAARVERDTGWSPIALGERGLGFRADATLSPPRLQLFPPSGGPAQGIGIIDLDGAGATYRAAIQIPVPAGRPIHLVLRVAGLPPGATVSPDVPPGTKAHERTPDEGVREWDLDVPASASSTFRAAIVARLPATGTVRLPTVWCDVGGAVPAESGVVRWLGVTGGEQRGMRIEGATPAAPVAIQAAWPGEAERLRRANGSVWSVPNGSPALVFPSPVVAPKPPLPSPAMSPANDASPAIATPESPRQYLPAVLWGLAACVVGVLFARLPRSTWPEQLGLLGGLFGYAVGGGWIVAVAVYGIARAAWLAGKFFGTRP